MNQASPVIERYGPDGFSVDGQVYTQPILILPDRVVAWPIARYEELGPETLAPVAEHGRVELLIIGSGGTMRPVPSQVRLSLRQAGIAVDGMATAAACRTYGVLAAEGRRVAAALLPSRY